MVTISWTRPSGDRVRSRAVHLRVRSSIDAAVAHTETSGPAVTGEGPGRLCAGWTFTCSQARGAAPTGANGHAEPHRCAEMHRPSRPTHAHTHTCTHTPCPSPWTTAPPAQPRGSQAPGMTRGFLREASRRASAAPSPKPTADRRQPGHAGTQSAPVRHTRVLLCVQGGVYGACAHMQGHRARPRRPLCKRAVHSRTPAATSLSRLEFAAVYTRWLTTPRVTLQPLPSSAPLNLVAPGFWPRGPPGPQPPASGMGGPPASC